jgi:hypothetical protein
MAFMKITKVILRHSDEVGGCRSAYPEYADGPASGMKHRGKRQAAAHP